MTNSYHGPSGQASGGSVKDSASNHPFISSEQEKQRREIAKAKIAADQRPYAARLVPTEDPERWSTLSEGHFKKEIKAQFNALAHSPSQKNITAFLEKTERLLEDLAGNAHEGSDPRRLYRTNISKALVPIYHLEALLIATTDNPQRERTNTHRWSSQELATAFSSLATESRNKTLNLLTTCVEACLSATLPKGNSHSILRVTNLYTIPSSMMIPNADPKKEVRRHHLLHSLHNFRKYRVLSEVIKEIKGHCDSSGSSIALPVPEPQKITKEARELVA